MRSRSRGTLAAVALTAALSAALAGWAFRGDADRREERPVLGHTELPEVAGYEGRMPLDAGELVLRLAPFHADHERQAFDTRALAARLGLGAGEPYRLELAWTPPAGAPGASATARELALDGLAIVARGAAPDAEPLVRPIERAKRDATSSTPADPLRTLLAAPSTLRVEPARGASVLVWGRAEGDALELRWLGRTTTLEARRWSADPLQDVLARVGPSDERAGDVERGDEERGR